MRDASFEPVQAFPYWDRSGTTFEDPDGYQSSFSKRHEAFNDRTGRDQPPLMTEGGDRGSVRLSRVSDGRAGSGRATIGFASSSVSLRNLRRGFTDAVARDPGPSPG